MIGFCTRWGAFVLAAVAWLGCGHVAWAQTTVGIARVAGNGTYTPGGTIDVTVTFSKSGSGTITQLALQETLPTAWKFKQMLAGGSPPEITPAANATGTINFAYLIAPAAFPVSFTYRLTTSAASTGTKQISGDAVYSVDGGSLADSPTVTTDITQNAGGEGEGEGEGQGPPDVTLDSRTVGGDGLYHPGGTLNLTVVFTYGGADAVSTLGFAETMPAGWTYAGTVSGSAPPVTPSIGASGTLNFAYFSVPPFPISFTYKVNVPVGTTGAQNVSGFGTYSTTGSQVSTNTLQTTIQEGTPGSEGEGEGEGEGQSDTLVLTRSFPNGSTYVAGATADITLRLTYGGVEALQAVGIDETLPNGWSYQGMVGGSPPPVVPNTGSTGKLSFAWISIPAFPVSFTYRVNIPGNATGSQNFSGVGRFRTTGAEQLTNPPTVSAMTEPSPSDLSVASFAPPATLYVGNSVKLRWQGENIGQIDAPGGWNDCVFLSSDATLGGDTQLGCATRSNPVLTGYAYDNSVSFTVPAVAPGNYFLLLSVNNDAGLSEANTANNLSAVPVLVRAITYDATVSTDTTIDTAGTPVTLSGTATLFASGQPAANSAVRVDVSLRGVVRTLSATTNGAGAFSVPFVPGLNEAGAYTISARSPGAAPQPAEDSFTLVGLSQSTDLSALQMALGQTKRVVVRLTNLADTELTNLDVVSLSNGIVVSATPPASLAADASVDVPVDVTTIAGAATGTIALSTTTAEGASVESDLALTLLTGPAALTVGNAVTAGAERGKQTLFTFDLSNTGGTAAQGVKVSVPGLSFASVVTPTPAGVTVAPGDVYPVTIQLNPPSNQAVGLLSSSMQLTSTGGPTQVLPLDITIASAATGTLTVTAQDELSAQGGGNIAGAAVAVIDPATGTVAFQNTTDGTGSVTFTNVPSGQYDVSVRAAGHGSATSRALVRTARTRVRTVLLPRALAQTTVVATPQHGDFDYEYTATTGFTNAAAAPVITVSPPFIDLSQNDNATGLVTLTVTNHGTVAAEQVRVTAGTQPRFALHAAINVIGTLGAGESVDVPVSFEDLVQTGGAVSTANDCDVNEATGVAYSWLVGAERVFRRAPVGLLLPQSVCPNAHPEFGQIDTPVGDNVLSATPPVTDVLLDCDAAKITAPGASDCASMRLEFAQPSLLRGRSGTLTFTLTNDGQSLTNIGVTLAITDENGADASGKFTLSTPAVTGMVGINGNGSISPSATGTAVWTLTPTGTAQGTYFVGGTLSFNRFGLGESFPLVPQRLLVLVPPSLTLQVFAPSKVYGDDIITTPIEAMENFGLGLVLRNDSASAVHGAALDYLSPEFNVKNDNDRNNFYFSGAFVATDAVLPRTNLDFGTIAPGASARAVYDASARYSGDFLQVPALFSRRDDDNNLRSALITTTETFNLLHVADTSIVGVDGPGFLIDQNPDGTEAPTDLFLNDGQTATVSLAGNVTLTANKDFQVQYTLSGTAQQGWSFFEVNSPVPAGSGLVEVRRTSDNSVVNPRNAWLTNRTFRNASNQITHEEKLRVLDFDSNGGYTVSFLVPGTQNTPPVANAGVGFSTFRGILVRLDGRASSDADDDPLTYAWTLTSVPSGSAATLTGATTSQPSFTPDKVGNYVAQLIVNDGTNGSTPATVTIVVGNHPPTADAGADKNAFVGNTVQVSAASSSDQDNDTISFTWSFVSRPQGSTAVLANANATVASFVPDKKGDYVVQVIANDGFDASPADTAKITVGNRAPTADAGTNQSGIVGAQITLDGRASTDPDNDTITFAWTFASRPAGSTAALTSANTAQPKFTIDVAGTYVAQLIVNDGTLPSDPDTVTISTSNTPPTANAGDDQSLHVGDLAVLDGSLSSDVDNDPLTYVWTFVSKPSGSTATLSDADTPNPIFTIDKPGSYVAQLVVNDGHGNSAPDTVTITTQNSAPVAEAGPSQRVNVGATVTLNGGGSTDVDGDTLTYRWTFTTRPGGSAAAFNNPNAKSPTFVVDIVGSYTARLIVNDGQADSAPDTVTVSTQNNPPVANAGPDQTVGVTQTVTLDGTASSDPDDDGLRFTWSFTSRPGGSAAALTGANTSRPTFRADKPGSYVVKLIVNDGSADSPADSVTITTSNTAPKANAGADQTGALGTTITLNGSASSDVDSDPLTFRWSLKSKPAGSTVVLQNANTVNSRFTIDKQGDYVIELVVNDGKVDSAADSVTVSTSNSRPVARVGNPQTRQVGQVAVLDGSGSSDPDNNPLTFAWTFLSKPAGSTATLQDAATVSPRFTVDAAGDFRVQLIVSDGSLSSDPVAVTVSTSNSAPVSNAGPDQFVAAGARVDLDGSASFDVDGDTLTFAWSFTTRPPNSNAALNSAAVAKPFFTLDQPGDYVLQLTVSDGTAAGTADTVNITTGNVAPVAVAGDDTSKLVGQQVSLNGSASFDGNNDALTYLWSFSSKPASSTATLTGPNTPTPSFRIDVPGIYVLQLVVNDGTTAGAPDSVVVSTSGTKPIANAGPDVSTGPGTSIALNGRNSIDPDGEELTFAWSIVSSPDGGDGGLVGPTQNQANFKATVPGAYSVQLIVNDGAQNSDPDRVTVTVTAAPGCAVIPAAPASVSASDGTFSDRVEVSWPASSGAVEYRVWRGSTNSAAAATPLSGWITGTLFNDLSAPDPTVTPASGCGGSPTVTPNPAFYFVQARASSECEGDTGVGDSGFKGAAAKSAAKSASEVYVRALPGRAVNAYTHLATPGDTLYVRLRSDGAPFVSVSGNVASATENSEELGWIAVDTTGQSDGWLAYTPSQPWRVGDTVQFTAQGQAKDGAAVGPYVYDFRIVAATDDDALPAGEYPPVAGALGPIYRIAPEAVYEGAQRVWVPIDADADYSDLAIYLYLDGGADGGQWVQGSELPGWLGEGPSEIRDVAGQRYLGIMVTHGGIVQAGPLPHAAEASMLPIRSRAGDFATLAMIALVLFAFRFVPSRVRADKN